MKVLFVTDFYHPYSGGVEIHVRTVAHELVSRGHSVAVATLPAEGRTPSPQHDDRHDDDGVEIFTVRHSAQLLGASFSHEHRQWAPPFPDPVATTGLRRVVRSFEPDVIHGHDWLARSALSRVVTGSVPVVTSLHYYTRSCAKKTLWRNDAVCPGPKIDRCLTCAADHYGRCLLYTSPSPRDATLSRMPSSA